MAYLYARDAHARFVAAFNFLSASKNVKLDDAKLEASFLVLGDLPIESVETAATALAREGTGCPLTVSGTKSRIQMPLGHWSSAPITMSRN